MSELGNTIRNLRGKMTAAAAAAQCGLSPESIYRMERGGSISRTTLHKVATGLNLDSANWLNLLVAWLYDQLGDQRHLIQIESLEPVPKSEADESQLAAFEKIFVTLSPSEQYEVGRALRSKATIAVIAELNRQYERAEKNQRNKEHYEV